MSHKSASVTYYIGRERVYVSSVFKVSRYSLKNKNRLILRDKSFNDQIENGVTT